MVKNKKKQAYNCCMKAHENNNISWISFVEPKIKNWLFEHLTFPLYSIGF
jgi:hypothetical protein